MKLVDHGHAFDLNRGFQSPFYARHQGQPLPSECMDAVTRFLAPRLGRECAELLDA